VPPFGTSSPKKSTRIMQGGGGVTLTNPKRGGGVEMAIINAQKNRKNGGTQKGKVTCSLNAHIPRVPAKCMGEISDTEKKRKKRFTRSKFFPKEIGKKVRQCNPQD